MTQKPKCGRRIFWVPALCCAIMAVTAQWQGKTLAGVSFTIASAAFIYTALFYGEQS